MTENILDDYKESDEESPEAEKKEAEMGKKQKLLRSKIKDVDNLSREDLEDGANWYDVEEEICMIDGEEYHLCIAKLCNVLNSESMPVATFVGDPGTGKTMAMGKIAEILHDEINVLRGSAEPEKNLNYDPINFMESIKEYRRTAVAKPEANTSYNSKDFNETDNRKNGNAINLSRTFGNLLMYDAQYLWETDTSIKNKDNIRFVACGGDEDYWFDVFKIERDNDDEKKVVDKIYLGRWKPDLPSDEFQSHVESMDTEWKKEKLEKDIEEMKKERNKSEESELAKAFA